MKEKYLRINEDSFGFVVKGIHSLLPTDIEVSEEEYNKFFEMQSEGKQFRLKTKQEKSLGLFGYVEEFIDETQIHIPSETELLQEEILKQTEYIVEMDYRLAKLEMDTQEVVK